MQADPCVSSIVPSLGSNGEPGDPLGCGCVGVWVCGGVGWVGGWVGWEGWGFLTKDESPHAGYTFTPWVVSFTPPSIYTSDNIYANCQSSAGCLVGCFKIQTFFVALWPFTYLWCMPKETHMPNFSIIVRVWSQPHRPPHPPHTPTHPHPHQNVLELASRLLLWGINRWGNVINKPML